MLMSISYNITGVAHPTLQNERHVESADGHNTAGQYDPSWHGTGQVMTSLPGFPADTDSRIMATTKSSLKSIFPFNKEMNNGNPIGVGWLQSTIGDGQRSSSATAFMQPTLVRKYVDLVINTRVTRLVQTGFGRSSKPEFLGVELGQPGSRMCFSILDRKLPVNLASENRRTIIAKREVIMSAGAINTPQILMLSGIGDPTALRAVGITPKVSLSAVGQALQDHPYMTIQVMFTRRTLSNISSDCDIQVGGQ
jgi:choline dehydrogenase-like flavoprotein